MGLISSLGRLALSEALYGVSFVAKLAGDAVAEVAKEPEPLGEEVGPFHEVLTREAQEMIASAESFPLSDPNETGFVTMVPPPLPPDELARRRANGIVSRTIDLTREEP